MVWADPPTIEGVFPAGGERGSNIVLTVAGKFEPWPPKVWIDQPGLSVESLTNKGQFSVAICPTAAPGPRLFRLYNEDGASELRIFVVGEGRETTEVEPNNRFTNPQWVETFPVTINGRLGKRDDVDSFGLRLRPAQWLEARVDSFTLLSKVDGVLRLVTTNGLQLDWNHDFITLDPRLVWHATNAEPVVVQFFGFAYPADAEIRLTGGDAAFYRLHIAVSNEPPAPFDVPAASGSVNREAEPNDTAAVANGFELPGSVQGTISHGGDQDRFRFAAASNQVIRAEVEAASQGAPLDAWLAIEDESGAELARNDDREGFSDPRVEWKAATNGNYILAIGSVTHRGGEPFHYHLTARPVYPDFQASLTVSSLVLTQATTNGVKMNLKRLRGFTNELRASVENLPSGIKLLPPNLDEKDGSATLHLTADGDAAPFQGLVKIVLVDSSTKAERVVPFELTSRAENNGVPGGYNRLLVERTPSLWLTVRPARKEKTKEEPTTAD